MTDKELDKKFEKMSAKCANNIKGTYPKTTKKSVKKPKRK